MRVFASALFLLALKAMGDGHDAMAMDDMEEIHGAEHMEEPKEEEGMDKKTQKSIVAWVGLGVPAAFLTTVMPAYIFGPAGLGPMIR